MSFVAVADCKLHGVYSALVAVEALKTVFRSDSLLYDRVINSDLDEQQYIFKWVSESPVSLLLALTPVLKVECCTNGMSQR